MGSRVDYPHCVGHPANGYFLSIKTNPRTGGYGVGRDQLVWHGSTRA